MNKILIFLFLIFVFINYSCNNETFIGNHSFFYWKSEYRFSENETKIAKEIGINHFYIKYFDVDWDELSQMAIPVSILENQFENKHFVPQNITPCVFITNTVLKKYKTASLADLATKIKRKIERIDEQIIDNYQQYIQLQNKKQKINDSSSINCNEIVIDCDWTENTKEKYFDLLNELKKQMHNRLITSTLRLWQYKYPAKAGIPPVDKCLLMCYSISNPKDFEQKNTIASFDAIKPYLETSKYKLPLDIALPIYSWGVLFRNSQFKGIISNVGAIKNQKKNSVIKPISANKFRFTTDTVIGNFYIRYGDEIRIEEISLKELIKIANLLKEKLVIEKQTRISFFSWDTIYLKQYETHELKKIYTIFN